MTDKYIDIAPRFRVWTANMEALAKAARSLPDWPVVDHNWLRSADPYAIAKLAEAIDYLEPKIAAAEALLARAVGAAKTKKET